MSFANSVVGGIGSLIRQAIQSPGFVSGSTGWSIFRNGSVEFNNGVFRGTLTAAGLTDTSISSSDFGSGTIHDSTISRTIITFDTTGGQLLVYSNTLASQTFNAAGNFTAPAGVTSLYRGQSWGPGRLGTIGGFGGLPGGGGGGGAYSEEGPIAVTPLTVYPVSMSAGNPTSCTFDAVTLIAQNGKAGSGLIGGLGGAASSNRIAFPGGNGGNGLGGTNNGGGGGGGAGPGGAGNNGKNATGSAGGTGGLAVTGGGHGSNGGTNANSGIAGSPAGGSGGVDSAHTPGADGPGQMILSWVTGTKLIGSISGETFTDALGNTIPINFMGNITAVDPVAVPQVPETWHTLAPLGAGWSQITGEAQPSYRLSADGNKTYISGTVQCIATAANIANGFVITTTALPAAYRPLNRRPVFITVRGSTLAPSNNINGLAFTAAGNLVVETIGANVGDTLTVRFDGSVKLDIPTH